MSDDYEGIDVITLGGGAATDTISVMDTMATTTLSDLNFGSGSAITGATGLYQATGPQYTFTNTTNPSAWLNPIGATNGSATISLQGPKADIDMGGKSLRTWMEAVESRLNILTVNPELEAEWDELRELGERYRELEKKCKEKTEIWNKLKAMPPPEVD